LLLDHFWLVTSIRADAMTAPDLLEHYRQRGTAEGLLGDLMDVLSPALSIVLLIQKSGECPNSPIRVANSASATHRCK